MEHRQANIESVAHGYQPQLFDWQLDVQRLEREADKAAATGAVDPWTLIEAECSLDLIDAELLALRHAPADRATASFSLLQRWRARTEALVQRLRELGGL